MCRYINCITFYQINISLKEPSTEATIVKDFLYHQGRSKIRNQLEKYIKDLKEGTSNIKIINMIIYECFQENIILLF